jgi:hypothetical protein
MSKTPLPKQVTKDLMKLDEEEFIKFLTRLSQTLNAMDKKPPGWKSFINRMVNLEDVKERSRYPTYPILSKNVYLEMLGDLIPEARAATMLKNKESSALIAYQGAQWEHVVKMYLKSFTEQETRETRLELSPSTQTTATTKPKRSIMDRILLRKPKGDIEH